MSKIEVSEELTAILDDLCAEIRKGRPWLGVNRIELAREALRRGIIAIRTEIRHPTATATVLAAPAPAPEIAPAPPARAVHRHRDGRARPTAARR